MVTVWEDGCSWEPLPGDRATQHERVRSGRSPRGSVSRSQPGGGRAVLLITVGTWAGADCENPALPQRPGLGWFSQGGREPRAVSTAWQRAGRDARRFLRPRLSPAHSASLYSALQRHTQKLQGVGRGCKDHSSQRGSGQLVTVVELALKAGDDD